MDSIDYDETLFRIADDCNLEIMSLTASEPENEEVKGTDITYTVTTFEVVVRSQETPPSTVDEFETFIDETVANMLDFIDDITTSEEFNVGTIELVGMENLEPPASADLEEADEAARRDLAPQATINIVIYGFSG